MTGAGTLTVLRSGPLTTVQDRGRLGWAHLGVPRGGALDAPAAALANRLVGNDPDRALLEVTMGGLVLRADRGLVVAVTGADTPIRLGRRRVAQDRALYLPAGVELALATPVRGVRSYLAVAGGIEVAEVLGSRATDTLAWVGPPQVCDGTRLPVGPALGPPRPHDVPRPPRPGPLRILPGPRQDWFVDDAVAVLCGGCYRVAPDSDRIGIRLTGPPLARSRSGELPSEPMLLGAVQVPPNGQPVVFLADHPTTGGYPVIGVVDPDDLWQCAQLRPGAEVRFTRG